MSWYQASGVVEGSVFHRADVDDGGASRPHKARRGWNDVADVIDGLEHQNGWPDGRFAKNVTGQHRQQRFLDPEDVARAS